MTQLLWDSLPTTGRHATKEVQYLGEWCFGQKSDPEHQLRPKRSLWTTGDPGRAPTHPLLINSVEAEIVDNIKFLGIHIAKDFTKSLNISHLIKRAHQMSFFLRKLKQTLQAAGKLL